MCIKPWRNPQSAQALSILNSLSSAGRNFPLNLYSLQSLQDDNSTHYVNILPQFSGSVCESVCVTVHWEYRHLLTLIDSVIILWSNAETNPPAGNWLTAVLSIHLHLQPQIFIHQRTVVVTHNKNTGCSLNLWLHGDVIRSGSTY